MKTKSNNSLAAILLLFVFTGGAMAEGQIEELLETAPPLLEEVGEPATTPADSESGILLNFRNASLDDFLNYLSEVAGFIILQEAPVSGTVNVVSRSPVSEEDAVDLLNTILAEKGYVALRNNRILNIVPREGAQRRNLPVYSGRDPEQIPLRDEVVTQIIPLRYVEAAKLVENLRPLLPEQATLNANESSNALLLTDTQASIRRVTEIVRALDTSVASISSIQVYPLRYADAKQLADVITKLFESDRSAREENVTEGWRFRRGGGREPEPPPPDEARQAAMRVVAVADEQSNSLVVSSPDELIETIADIVQQIDTSISTFTETRLFQLQNADAVELAALITDLYDDPAGVRQTAEAARNAQQRGGRGRRPAEVTEPSQRSVLQSSVVAVGDPRTNSLLISAAEELMDQIAETVIRLDASGARRQRVYVYDLENADVENVAALLRGMFQDPNGQDQRATGAQRLSERSATGASTNIQNQGSGVRGRR